LNGPNHLPSRLVSPLSLVGDGTQKAAFCPGQVGWAFVKYSRDYVRQEAESKADRLGVHEHGCDAAWEWRAKHGK
jgi:hypothetical protein